MKFCFNSLLKGASRKLKQNITIIPNIEVAEHWWWSESTFTESSLFHSFTIIALFKRLISRITPRAKLFNILLTSYNLF